MKHEGRGGNVEESSRGWEVKGVGWEDNKLGWGNGNWIGRGLNRIGEEARWNRGERWGVDLSGILEGQTPIAYSLLKVKDIHIQS